MERCTYLTQKQLTSTTLVQLEAEMALSKQVVTTQHITQFKPSQPHHTQYYSPQVETPLKLGYWAELVVLALVLEELLVTDVVAVALTLRDTDTVEEEKTEGGASVGLLPTASTEPAQRTKKRESQTNFMVI